METRTFQRSEESFGNARETADASASVIQPFPALSDNAPQSNLMSVKSAFPEMFSTGISPASGLAFKTPLPLKDAKFCLFE